MLTSAKPVQDIESTVKSPVIHNDLTAIWPYLNGIADIISKAAKQIIRENVSLYVFAPRLSCVNDKRDNLHLDVYRKVSNKLHQIRRWWMHKGYLMLDTLPV